MVRRDHNELRPLMDSSCGKILHNDYIKSEPADQLCLLPTNERHCKEFVVMSPPFCFKKWLLLTVFFNILGFTFRLQEQDSRLLSALLVTAFVAFLIRLHFKVHKESLLVMATLGVQLTTTFASGRTKARFYHLSHIQSLVINEAVTMHRVIFYLVLLLRTPVSYSTSAKTSEQHKLVPLFTNSWPRLHSLQLIYRGFHSVLNPEKLQPHILHNDVVHTATKPS